MKTTPTDRARASEWPHIYPRTYRSGRVAYVCDCGAVNGKRLRVAFRTRAEADVFAEQKRVERENEGARALALSAAARSEAAQCQQKLAPYGASLTQATDHYVQHVLQHRAAPSVAEMIDRLLQQKVAAGLRDSAVRTARSFLRNNFAARFGRRRLHEVTLAELNEICLVPSLAPRTQLNRIRLVSELCNHAVRNGWISENLAKRIPVPPQDENEPGILMVDQAARLLAIADEFGLRPHVALGLFAGVRRCELLRLDWSAIRLTDREIVIGAKVAKTRARRVIPFDDPLAAWLRSCARTSGPVVDVRSFAKHFTALRQAAGISNWPPNALRHSFASYHVQMYKDPIRTAYLMGHTGGTAMLDRHYRGLVTGTEAERFWALRPVGITAPVAMRGAL